MHTLKDKLEKLNIVNKCEKCVNLLELEEGKFTCDYDYFEDVSNEELKEFTAQYFKCNEFSFLE